MGDQGWISLYRKIQNSFVWTNSDQLKLWLLILMKANHSENKFLFNGEEISVTSGQMVTGAHILASEFNEGVPRDKAVTWRTLWRWIKKFENAEMLTIKSTTKYSVITVNNWSEYQEHDKPVTKQRQATDNPMTTNNNDNNEDKEPHVDYAALISYLNEKSGRAFHNTEANRKLIKARLNDGFTKKDFKLVIDYKSTEWKDNKDMQKYLRPNTLFAPSHFDDYLNEAKEYLNHANRTKTTSDGQCKGKTPEEIVNKEAEHLKEIERRAQEAKAINEH
ncbi:conserved phage C-terminal domain-containing protein [Pediococcus acidilactici]|uniref:conserved phage C-terminal domain-containing protein n=1 Tax=Pediococcus acidilactici TaxID=1254 RepID=UPI0001BEDEC7|nr:conserved phage C-terminal domain-containing protein [Pediococcus acidilactici]EFA25810.1 hypothetical protein HMPREF9024_01833 [Pediococcus acidilactici 7_4]MDD9324574.1 conserved phage C-terminal domain-containing protein [Pediococcus acidilactici]